MRLQVEQCQGHLPAGRPPVPPLAWCELVGHSVVVEGHHRAREGGSLCQMVRSVSRDYAALGLLRTESRRLWCSLAPRGAPRTPPSTRGCPGPHSEGTGTGVWGQGQPPVSPGAWAAAWAATPLPQHCAHPVLAATTWPLLASAAGGRYTFCIWLSKILPRVSPELWFHGGSGRPPPGTHRSGSPWEGLSKHRTLTYPNCSPAQKRI